MQRSLRLRLSQPVSLLLFLVVVLPLVGCEGSERSASGPVATGLVQRWSEVRVEDAIEPKSSGIESVIQFGPDSDATWSTVQGIEDLRVEDGALTGRTTSMAPLILIELPQPMGEGDQIWSVEARLQVDTGSRMAIHPVFEMASSTEEVIARVEEIPISSPLVPGESAKTYRIELDDVLLFGLMPAIRLPQKFLVRPTNVAGAAFSVESIRLTFRQEHLASIRSGPGWHGLGEVFRETIVSRAPETLIFDVTLPEKPWLGVALGSVEDTPPTFQIAVSSPGGDAEVVGEFRPEAPESWQLQRVDLSPWAGESVQLHLAAKGEPGSLAFWGAPTIRGSLAPDSIDRPQLVLVVLADTLRPDHLDAWGYGRETAPTLSRLASEGVRFEDVVAQSSWTKPSVSSILTSIYPTSLGIVGLADRVLAPEMTLAEVYRKAGYATFATSSVPFTGQLTNLHQGVQVLHEFGSVPQAGGEFRSKTAGYWVDTFLPWLEVHRDVPVFAFIHVMDPHFPYEPEAPHDTTWATEADAQRYSAQSEIVKPHIANPLLRRFNAPNAQELAKAEVDAESFVRHELNWYDGSIRAMDDHLARLMQQIERLGLSEDTLLAFVSDHGEEFLEHGRHSHGTSVYGELVQVPLMLWGRGVPKSREVDQTVENIDLYPTLLELSNLDPPERIHGESLVPLFDDSGRARRDRPAFTELAPSLEPGTWWKYGVVEEDWKLVWNRDAPGSIPEFELYDHLADPHNLQNVADEHPEVVARLALRIRRWQAWASGQKLDAAASEAEMSAAELEQLRSLGYVD